MNAQTVKDAVKTRLDAGEAFTSACISHPLIESDESIRHYDVSEEIRALWRQRQMTGPNDVGYLRTLVTVYPDGPGSFPAQAYLYYPDNGYDPHSFTATSRVLIRSDADPQDDDAIIVTQTSDGSSVSKQCQVQTVEKTLNVPKFIITKLGWAAGAGIVTAAVASGGVEIKRTTAPDAGQKVDKEGRIRLHGWILSQIGTDNPTALLVEPTSGENYILISAMTAVPAPADGSTPAADGAPAVMTPSGISVWDDPKKQVDA